MNFSWFRPKSRPKPSLVDSQLKRLYQDTARRFGLKGRACQVSVLAQMGLEAHTEKEALERAAILIHAPSRLSWTFWPSM